MNALQKVKLTKELLGLVGALTGGSLKALEKVKTTKRVLELVDLLGGASTQPNENTPANDYTAFLQSIINGELNIHQTPSEYDTLKKAHEDENIDPDLLTLATFAAARQVVEANGYVVID